MGRPIDRPAAWDATVLDDFAFNRPWNLLVKYLRVLARFRTKRLRHGTTIVIVNWNTIEVTRDALWAVRALTGPEVDITIVDNGSTDGSRAWLRDEDGIRGILLPANAGHAIALDIATLMARTEIVVTLDSDAVPLSEAWLDAVLVPMRESGTVLAGLRSSRDFVHPVFLAVDVASFVRRRLSFQVFREPGVTDDAQIWGVNSWDTAELMTGRLDADEIAFVDTSPNPVSGLPGMTAGGVVYHHGGVTRSVDADAGNDSYCQWRSAIGALLPVEALRPCAVARRVGGL